MSHSPIHIGEIIFTDENVLFRELPLTSNHKVYGMGETESVDHFWLGCHITSAVDRSVFGCGSIGKVMGQPIPDAF